MKKKLISLCVSYFNDEFVPFTIICHAKRLLKMNLLEMALCLYEKVNESKNSFLAAFKSSHQRMQTEMAMNYVSNKLMKLAEQQVTKNQNNKGKLTLDLNIRIDHNLVIS